MPPPDAPIASSRSWVLARLRTRLGARIGGPVRLPCVRCHRAKRSRIGRGAVHPAMHPDPGQTHQHQRDHLEHRARHGDPQPGVPVAALPDQDRADDRREHQDSHRDDAGHRPTPPLGSGTVHQVLERQQRRHQLQGHQQQHDRQQAPRPRARVAELGAGVPVVRHRPPAPGGGERERDQRGGRHGGDQAEAQRRTGVVVRRCASPPRCLVGCGVGGGDEGLIRPHARKAESRRLLRCRHPRPPDLPARHAGQSRPHSTPPERPFSCTVPCADGRSNSPPGPCAGGLDPSAGRVVSPDRRSQRPARHRRDPGARPRPTRRPPGHR